MLTPSTFQSASVYELLEAAARGQVGIDQRWLKAILDRGEEAVPDLVRFGVEDRSGDAIDIDDALLLIFRHLKSPNSAPFFVEYLRRNTDVPDEFAEAIYPIREAAFEPLLGLYEELEEDQSGEVAFTLAYFRIRDERVLRILLDRLEYDATEGAIALSLYGDPAAKPALERMIADLEDDHLKNQLQDAINDIDNGSAEHIDEPFDIFEQFPDNAGPEAAALEEPELIEMLDSPDADYRFAAAGGFINNDYSDETREKLLEHAREDDDPAVRGKCWEALAGDVVDNDEVYHAMLACLEDEKAEMIERAGALVGLGQRANEEPVRKHVEAFYESPETRAAALSAMWNSLDRSFSKYFPPHVEDEDREVRLQAIMGVGYLGVHEAADKLKQYFEDEDYRSNALFAYALCVRAEVTPSRVRALLRRIEEAAGGLSEEENELVQIALDERLMLNGHKPVFRAAEHRHGPGCDHDHAEESETPAAEPAKPVVKAGRNDPCPCGSGKKFKKCCGA